jgi:hypothetical protein
VLTHRDDDWGRLMTKKVLFALALLISVPLLVDQGISERGERHSEMVRKYERYCLDAPCTADFNGDGRQGLLMIDREKPPAPGYDSWLVVVEDGRELLRLPHWFIDGSFRTHIAIRNDSGGDRLLVFDGTHAPTDSSTPPTRLVFAWNGQRIVDTPPTEIDRDIFLALATRDDSGTFNAWTLYEFIGFPVLICYYLLLAGIVGWLTLRRKLKVRRAIGDLQ